jgi:hypothetical protein
MKCGCYLRMTNSWEVCDPCTLARAEHCNPNCNPPLTHGAGAATASEGVSPAHAHKPGYQG